jgi:hypothetical protein
MNQSGNDKDGHSANENTEMTIQHDPFFITIGLVGTSETTYWALLYYLCAFKKKDRQTLGRVLL